ncbi:hypothetical protein D3C75_1036820 [compost metagenome]
MPQAATYGIVVFHHNFFGDDAHVQQVTVKNFFTITEAWVETRVCVRVTDQRDFIPFLQHSVTVRVCQNTVTANTFDIATGLAINTQFAQIFAIRPGNKFRTDAVGADNGQVNFACGIGIQTAFTSDLLSAGLQILVLKFWQITRTNN